MKIIKLYPSLLRLLCVLSCINLYATMTMHEYFIDMFRLEPVSTEFRAYTLLKENPIKAAVNYLAIPWVVLINTNQLHRVPDIKLNGGFTICQHIHYEKIIPTLSKLGVDILFAPHAIQGKKYGSVTVLPFPIYAVNGVNPTTKNLWYSFIGANTHPVRQIIFKLPTRNDCFVVHRNGWHFWQPPQQREQEKQEYQDVLARSRFSLCPRGTGASTIRFWESLQAGAIPVLLADEMSLPENIDWDSCIVRIPEKDASKIPALLNAISPEKEDLMRKKCLDIYKQECEEENFVNYIRYWYRG